MNPREKLITALLLGLIILLYIAYITVNHYVDALTNRYDDLQSQIKLVKQDNLKLQDTVLRQEAYTTIEQKAKAQGFTELKVYYLR